MKKVIDISKAQPDVIRKAAEIEDFREAVRLIQDAIGQDDGGVAGIHFSGDETDEDGTPLSWKEAPWLRKLILLKYVQAEAADARQHSSCEEYILVILKQHQHSLKIGQAIEVQNMLTRVAKEIDEGFTFWEGTVPTRHTAFPKEVTAKFKDLIDEVIKARVGSEFGWLHQMQEDTISVNKMVENEIKRIEAIVEDEDREHGVNKFRMKVPGDVPVYPHDSFARQETIEGVIMFGDFKPEGDYIIITSKNVLLHLAPLSDDTKLALLKQLRNIKSIDNVIVL